MSPEFWAIIGVGVGVMGVGAGVLLARRRPIPLLVAA